MNIFPRLPDVLSPVLEKSLRPYREHLVHAMEQLRSRNRGTIQDIQIELADDQSLNARAFTTGTGEGIAINAGVAITLPFFFHALLGNPQAFPSVGNPAADEPSQQPLDAELFALSGRARDLEPGVNWRPRMSVSNDPVRFHYATYLSMVAWDFLLFHEIAHIVRCHVAYLAEAGFGDVATPRLSMDEFEKNIQQDAPKLRRSLEADADTVAARVQVGGHHHNDPAVIGQSALGPYAPPTRWTWDDVCESWFRAVGLLFQLMAIRDRRDVRDEARMHPHPDVRLFIIANEAWANWKQLIPTSDRYASIAKSVHGEIETLLRSGVLPSSFAREQASYSGDFNASAEELRSGMNAIRPRLNELTEERLARA